MMRTWDIGQTTIEGYQEELFVRANHDSTERKILASEYEWVKNRRAFYNVYPAVSRCLQNTSLRIVPSQICGPLRSVAICFAKGSEIAMSNGTAVAMIFSSFSGMFDLRTREVSETPWISLSVMRIRHDGKTAYTYLEMPGDEILDGNENDSDGILAMPDKRRLLSLAIGVAVLAKDERYAEPILLNRDSKRLLTPEQMKQAIERAKRNGRNGMSIGKDIEVSPHVRRPHMAIRWTGIGATTPRLVPVSGCLVRRSELFPVPTGYMDE
jgi:hypothetical protein